MVDGAAVAAPSALMAALGAEAGVVCVAGAGGKKSLMRRLALAHPGPVGFTATTRIPPPPEEFGGFHVIVGDDDQGVARAAREHRIVVFTGPPERDGRLAGLAPERIAAIHRAAGLAVTYVKADGARMRLIKAPGPGEPVLVPGAMVLLVVAARAVGRALDDRVAHRPARLAQLAGAKLGQTIEPGHVARLIAAQAGAIARAGHAVVPVVTMADDPALVAIARDIAQRALAAGVPGGRVVLASLTAEEPLVGVVS